LPELLRGTLLPEMAATAVVGCVLYLPMRLFCGLLQKKDGGGDGSLGHGLRWLRLMRNR
jgi:hypothetical protein